MSDPKLAIETIQLFLIVGLSGAFGGIISGLNSFICAHRTTAPNRCVSCKILEHTQSRSKCTFYKALIGMAGAFIAIFVFETIGTIDDTMTSKGIIKLIGFGIAAGLVSQHLLDKIHTNLDKTIQEIKGFVEDEIEEKADAKLDKAVKEIRTEQTKSEFAKDYADAARTKLVEVRAGTELDEKKRIQMISKALEELDISNKIYESSRTWSFCANAFRLLSSEPSHTNDRDVLLTKAIEAVEKGLSQDDVPQKRQALLFWNRACYKSLLKFDARAVIEDLEKAIELDIFWKDKISGEADLTNHPAYGQICAHFGMNR